jgi:hypothetical protein
MATDCTVMKVLMLYFAEDYESEACILVGIQNMLKQDLHTTFLA